MFISSWEAQKYTEPCALYKIHYINDTQCHMALTSLPLYTGRALDLTLVSTDWRLSPAWFESDNKLSALSSDVFPTENTLYNDI